MVTVSLYARVSSDKQAQENTIASQIAVLERQISMDGHELLREYKFIDNGYSGSNIIRPDLEKLRDSVAEGQIDKIYVHSPDRLSRKYAYQIVLLEEFERAGVEVIFLNNQINNSPESNLLLQMQGMIAEYERAKIMERNRRGRIYAANKGSINVMGDAPYGYRYINKHAGGGQAVYEIIDEEAEVVRKVFFLVAKEGLSSNEVVRRLTEMSVITRTGKKYWNRGTICHMLKNPAYKGQAAFGKTKKGERLYSTRTRKNSCEHPKDNSSTYSVEKENWIYIPVPSIVDEDLFDMVQEQLAENLKRQRARQTGSKHLLQGLIVCQRCNYAYYGRRNAGGKHVYYRCTGSDARYFGGKRICDNKPVSGNTLEIVVWEEVKNLLKNPNRILNEYQRRLSGLKKLQLDQKIDSIEKQESKLKRIISKFIDSYAKEYIDQEEFESRIKGMKQQLKAIEEQKKRTYDQKDLQNEMTLVVTNLEDFASSIKSKLEDLDWITKRDIIRTLVKRIEVDLENINIVFRVEEVKGDPNLQHCRRRIYDGVIRVAPLVSFQCSYNVIPSPSSVIPVRDTGISFHFMMVSSQY